jgi:hypothetical protein
MGAVGVLLGCISTDVATGADEPICVWSSTERPRFGEAVVRISADLEPGGLDCSGVAIADRLVVTSLNCVVRPAEGADPNTTGDPTYRGAASAEVLFGAMPFGACSEAWLPLEDGSFTARLGKPIAASSIAVWTAGASRATAAANVFASRELSRCTGGVALLSFDRALDVTPIPIRIDETSELQEEVILHGYCVSGGMAVPNPLESTIEAISSNSGNGQLPPRSLLLAQGTTELEAGGPVLSRETGALVGIIASGAGGTCVERDADARTIATRLAPHRRLLLDAARSAQITLMAEPSGAAPWAPCAGSDAP